MNKSKYKIPYKIMEKTNLQIYTKMDKYSYQPDLFRGKTYEKRNCKFFQLEC